MHDATIEDVKAAFVDAFVGSERRRQVWVAYCDHLGELVQLVGGEPREQWMDVSFTTSKPEPKDVDTVVFVPEHVMNALDHDERLRFYRLVESPLRAPKQMVECYCVPIGEPGTKGGEATAKLREYWEGQYGRQRESDGGYSKGIVRLWVGGQT